jgi:hypothetical protein
METDKCWIVYADDVLSKNKDMLFCYYVDGTPHRWVIDIEEATTFTMREASHIVTGFFIYIGGNVKMDIHPRFRYE